MTRSEVAKVVSHIRFAPGWKFSVDQNGDVRVLRKTQCAYTKKRKLVPVYGFVQNTNLITRGNARRLLSEIRSAILDVHHHETAEWFRYKGDRIFDAGH